MEDGPKIGAFLNVFEEKLSKLKKNIKKELEKDKKSRNKSFLKQQLKESKHLKKVAKNIREVTNNLEHKVVCPHCKVEFICDQMCDKNK